jgi:hypothetical protein
MLRARARLVGAQRILIFWPFCIVLTLLLCCGVNLCAMNDCFFCVDDAEFLSPCADEISVITSWALAERETQVSGHRDLSSGVASGKSLMSHYAYGWVETSTPLSSCFHC